MAKYPIYTEYNDNGIIRENNLQCNGITELKNTLKALIKQGDIIKGVCKINKYGEYIPYDYKKII
jgi:hypothetical protein